MILTRSAAARFLTTHLHGHIMHTCPQQSSVAGTCRGTGGGTRRSESRIQLVSPARSRGNRTPSISLDTEGRNAKRGVRSISCPQRRDGNAGGRHRTHFYRISSPAALLPPPPRTSALILSRSPCPARRLWTAEARRGGERWGPGTVSVRQDTRATTTRMVRWHASPGGCRCFSQQLRHRCSRRGRKRCLPGERGA